MELNIFPTFERRSLKLRAVVFRYYGSQLCRTKPLGVKCVPGFCSGVASRGILVSVGGTRRGASVSVGGTCRSCRGASRTCPKGQRQMEGGNMSGRVGVCGRVGECGGCDRRCVEGMVVIVVKTSCPVCVFWKIVGSW